MLIDNKCAILCQINFQVKHPENSLMKIIYLKEISSQIILLKKTDKTIKANLDKNQSCRECKKLQPSSKNTEFIYHFINIISFK